MAMLLVHLLQIDQVDPTFWDNAKYTAIYLGVFAVVMAVFALVIYIFEKVNHHDK